MISIRRFGEKPTPWFENAVHFLEHSVRVGDVFEHVVCEDDIEVAVWIRNRLARPHNTFIQEMIVQYAWIRIDAADFCCNPPEIHMRRDAGTCTEVQHDMFRLEMRQDRFSK